MVPGEVNSQRALVLGVLGSGGWMMGGRAARRAVGWGWGCGAGGGGRRGRKQPVVRLQERTETESMSARTCPPSV